MFKAGTITYQQPFTRDLGATMARALSKDLGRKPDVCWLFASPHKDLENLVRGVVRVLGHRNLVGCTSDGEISNQGFHTGSVVLAGIATDLIDFQVVSTSNLGLDSEEAGKRLAQKLSPGVKFLQVFSDGLTGNGCALLRGIARVLGPHIPVAGGSAADDGKFEQTWQFSGDEVLTDGAVAIGLYGDFHLGTGVASGWSPVGIEKKVTRAKGNIIYELNGQPALEVYQRFLGKHAEKLPRVGVEYPLALMCPVETTAEDDYCLFRATVSVNHEGGSLIFAGEVPEGTKVRLTCADRTSVLKAVKIAAENARRELEGRTPLIIFLYSCMARKILLGRYTREELHLVREIIGGDIPVVGFYTYGEYCRIKPEGPNLLHNETVALSVLGL